VGGPALAEKDSGNGWLARGKLRARSGRRRREKGEGSGERGDGSGKQEALLGRHGRKRPVGDRTYLGAEVRSSSRVFGVFCD